MDSRRSQACKKGLALGLLAMLVVTIVSGCQHQTFLSKDVFDEAHNGVPLKKLEQNECAIQDPISAMTKAPATVIDSDRAPRYLTLQETFAIALENGAVSGRGGAASGQRMGIVDDTQASISPFGGSLIPNQTERIRVLAMYPAITKAAMEGQLARFDPIAFSTMSWQNTDELQQGLQSFQNGHAATFLSGLVKPLATGGYVSTTFLVGYQNLNNPPSGAFSILNPQYTSRLILGFEQPLWKDSGVTMNQLLSRSPTFTGQSLNPGASAGASSAISNRQGQLSSFVDRQGEGILISRLRFDQQRAEFERAVNLLIVNVENAYWNLYNKYGQLYSFEENLRIMHKTWQESYIRFKGGKLAPETYYQIIGQYEDFRAERIRALAEVIEAERNLRGIMGLGVEDGTRLVPITPPTLTELRPNWEHSLQEALNLRPELQMVRDNLRYHQYLLSIQKNYLRPDLRAFARYEPVGFGTSLTGNGSFVDGTGTTRTANSLESVARGQFVDWTVGLNLSMPLGWRYELAAIRAAKLELAQSYLLVKDQEEKATRYLHFVFNELAHRYKTIEAHRSERINYQKGLKIRLQQLAAGTLNFGGNEKEGPLVFLDAQRRYAAALVKEYNAIAEYNNALAKLEWAKGTILRYNNVHISEGGLPQGVQVRAVEYEKERSQSLMLRTRPDSLSQPGRLCDPKHGGVVGPMLEQRVFDANADTPSSLPSSLDVNWAPPVGAPKQPLEVVPAGTPKQPIEVAPITVHPTIKDPTVTPRPLPRGDVGPAVRFEAKPLPLPIEFKQRLPGRAGHVEMDAASPLPRQPIDRLPEVATPPLPAPPVAIADPLPALEFAPRK
ncbi:MAG: TolC family protein [Planctomycetes bacterium]|nr:TolC family protein [Planctomycetota bacterium]